MRYTVRQLSTSQRFDIVHADQLTMGQFALTASGPRRILDAHNAVWTIMDGIRKTAPLPFHPILAFEARRLKAYEGRLCREMDAVLAVSDVDRQALVEAGACNDKISVIPIAVSCSNLQPVSRAEASSEILTAGTLFYPPNADGVRWFLREVYPLVKRQMGSARLTVVGPRPPKDIVRFAEREADGVKVTGYVPDLRPYFERAALMVVPVRAGSGMRVRILEALARGMPVVTTTLGAEGIDVVPGEHLLMADEPTEFARAVVRLLRDPALCRLLAVNGRRLIEQKYDWHVVLPRLESVYASVLGN
jgi:glycosyltransferase involved in cell wall biosynthesis